MDASECDDAMLLSDDASPLVPVATDLPLARADPVKWVIKHSGGGYKFLIDRDGNVFVDTWNLPEHSRAQSAVKTMMGEWIEAVLPHDSDK